MIIQRDLIHSLKPFLNRSEYIAIIGPRQSGKTTFLQIIRKYLCNEQKVSDDLIRIITFEDRRLLAQFDADPVSFIKSYIPDNVSQNFYLMIDEFQYAMEGRQKLKLIYDTVKGLKIIITGSSSLDIKAQVGKFMVGRILSFHLYPFNFGEFLRARDDRLERIYIRRNRQVLNFLSEGNSFDIESGVDVFNQELIRCYEDFCIWGGYPAVVLARRNIERKKLLADIYNGYIIKDIKTLLELATEKNLYLLSRYLAAHSGNIIVYKNLSTISGLDFRQLKRHLAILDETFVCTEVKPFFRNRQKELTKNPKIFFLDMGFRNNLVENMNDLEKRSDAGAIVENAVFIRLDEICKGINKINFWRTKAGAEVDFILHLKNNIILPIEVKYSFFEAGKISRSLASFIDSFKPEFTVVLTRNYSGSLKRGNTNVLFFPVYYL